MFKLLASSTASGYDSSAFSHGPPGGGSGASERASHSRLAHRRLPRSGQAARACGVTSIKPYDKRLLAINPCSCGFRSCPDSTSAALPAVLQCALDELDSINVVEVSVRMPENW